MALTWVPMREFEKDVDTGSPQWRVSWGGAWLPFGGGSSEQVACELGLIGERDSARGEAGQRLLRQSTAWARAQRCEGSGAGLWKV